MKENENGGRTESSVLQNFIQLRGKFFQQSVQMAYIAIKTSKITKLHELTLIQKG